MQNAGQQGLEMEARIGVSFLANQLAQFAGRLGIQSDLGKALHHAAGILAQAVPPGSVPPGAEQAFLQKLMLAARQNQANVAAMRQQGAGGPPQAGAPAAPVPRPPGAGGPPVAGAGGMGMAA